MEKMKASTTKMIKFDELPLYLFSNAIIRIYMMDSLKKFFPMKRVLNIFHIVIGSLKSAD